MLFKQNSFCVSFGHISLPTSPSIYVSAICSI